MKCSFCRGEAVVIDWEPMKGYDPSLVKYKCLRCKLEFYTRTKWKRRYKK